MRFSPASMLTALAILVAPDVATRAQPPGPESSANAGASGSKTSAKVATPEVTAEPTTAEAEPMPSQADVSKKVIAARKAKDARKKAAVKAKQANVERLRLQLMWMQMVAMMRQSEIELERARLQAAQMEGAQRREAEASMVQLRTALSNARAMEFQQDRETFLSRDHPDQYRRLVQAQIDAYNAQQQAIRDLTQRVTRVIRERQGGSTTPLAGTTGSARSSQGSTTWHSPTSSNSGGAVTRAQPSPPPVQRLEFKDRDDMAKMRARNKF